MKKLIIGIVLVVGLTLGSQAQMPQPSAPRGRVISLSLVEALVAVEAQDLSFVIIINADYFGFSYCFCKLNCHQS